MAISKEQWAAITAELSRPHGKVELKCGEHSVVFLVERVKALKYAIITYVDGEWRGEWMKAESLEVIRAQCEAQDLVLRRNLHDAFLSDFVVVQWPTAPLAAVYFSTVNGWFFGTTDTGVSFDSREPPDDEPWFAALLEFFLVPLDKSGLWQVPFDGYTSKLHGSMS